MALGLACIVLLAFSAGPSIDPKTFGLSDPMHFAPTDSKGNDSGTLNYRSFSSSLTRLELADRIANLPVLEEVKRILVTCAVKTYPSYVTAHDEVVTRHANRYFEMCANLVVEREATGKPPTPEKFREQIREAETIQRELIFAEHSFIQTLQDCLDNAMIDSDALGEQDNPSSVVLESLLLRADYRFCENDTALEQRGTDVNLRNLVNQLDLALPVRQNLEVDLLSFERSMATLKPAQYKSFWDRAPRIRALIDRSEDGKIDRASFHTQIGNINSASGRIGMQIYNETMATATKIALKLPKNKQAAFTRAVQKAVFPEIDLDPLGDSLLELFTTILARPNLSRDEVDRIMSFQQSWNAEFDAWKSKAATTFLEWSYGHTTGEPSYDSEFFFPVRDKLLEMRNEIHERWRTILADQFPAFVK